MPVRLNLNHLHYFWAVARHASVSRAAEELGVSQPAVSSQIRALERSLGKPLFERRAGRLWPTPVALAALRHAEHLFRAADDLVRAVEAGDGGARLEIGAADAVPKVVVRTLIEPLLRLRPRPVVVCREWRTDHLFAELSLHRLDLVISDSPMPPHTPSRTISQVVGQSAIGVYATPRLAKRYRAGFPRSLDGAPMIMPADNAELRGTLDRWLEANGVTPRIIAEVEDRSLMNYLAESGRGLTPGAAVVEHEIKRQFGLARVGWAKGVREQYYAVFEERSQRKAGVAAVVAAARAGFVHGAGH